MTKLIAEIGWNFLGNINLAKEMISAAKDLERILLNFKHGQQRFS